MRHLVYFFVKLEIRNDVFDIIRESLYIILEIFGYVL